MIWVFIALIQDTFWWFRCCICCGLNIYLYNFWWKVWLSLAWLLAAGGGIDARTDSNEIKLMATGCRRVESTNQPSHHQTLAIVSIIYWRLSLASSIYWVDIATNGIMGRRFRDGGLLRYRKWVPQQLGDVIVVTNSPPIGHMRSQLTNHQVGIVLDVQVWSEKLY